MDSQIELGYLVLEVPDPDTLTPVLADVVGLVPGEPAPGGTTWRNDERAHRVLVTPGAAERRRRRRRRGEGRRARSTPPWPGCRRSAPTSSRARPPTSPHDASVAWPAPGRRGGSTSRSSSTSPTRAPRSRPRWCPGGFLTEGVGFGHAVFATTAFEESHAFLTDGLGFGQSDWLETELAPGHRPRGALLPLQPPPPHGRARKGAVRPPAAPAPRHVRAQRARRRRRRVRPGVGGRAAHPERARPPRQRRDVQLLPADPGRLPDRGRPRRAR